MGKRILNDIYASGKPIVHLEDFIVNRAITPEKELEEKRLLLSLSKDIAHIRARTDLNRLIREKFKNLFYFYHCTICILNEDRVTFRAFLLDPDSKVKVHTEYRRLVSSSFDLNNGIDNVTLQYSRPVYYDFDQLAQQKKLPDHGYIIQESGIHESISVRLTNENEAFGFISFFSDQKESFTPRDFSMIDSIASLIAPAVANIIANDQVVAKTREREIMLSISDGISKIKDRQGLFNIIDTELKKLFYFTHSIITKITEDGKFMTPFILDPNSRSLSDPNYHKIVSGLIPVDDELHEPVLASTDCINIDLETAAAKPGAPNFIKMNYATGLREMAAIILRRPNQRPLGTLAFYSDVKGNFRDEERGIIKAVAYHLSTAMSNVINNEDIAERDQENETLLSMAHAIASVREKNDLLKVINKGMNQLLHFSDVAIAFYNKGSNRYSIYAENCPTLGRHKDFRAMLTHPFEIRSFNEELLSSDKPVFLTIPDVSNIDKPFSELFETSGIREFAFVRMRDGNDVLGCIIFMGQGLTEQSEKKRNLIQRISYHVATAMANLIANEANEKAFYEIRQREEEKSMLLSFSKAVNTVRTKRELSESILAGITDFLNCNTFLILLYEEGGTTLSNYIDVLRGNIGDSAVMTVLRQDEIPESDSPRMIDLDEAEENENFFLIYKNAGMHQVITIPMQEGNMNLGQFFLFVEQPFGESQELLRHVEGITYQISSTVANLLANGKIQEQLQQIEAYKTQLEEENQYLQEEISEGYSYDDIVGIGPEMQNIFNQLSQVSFVDSTVLILGETGTGKELIARALHNASPRRDKLMVKVNCAALPPNLIESELFGHEKGSFTGATERRIGKFELANLGTLFLDEIGEMPLDMQVKLLRAIQEKEFERVGGKSTIKTDVRIIAATNRDLRREVDEGRFRGDLFYRINVFPILLPPLRERKGDIPALAHHFMKKFAKNAGKKMTTISARVLKELGAYHWPGNVRELEHLIERSILTTTGTTLQKVALPAGSEFIPAENLKSYEDQSRDYILSVLNHCNGKVYGPGGAAEILKMNISTLNSKIKKLGIEKGQTFFRKPN